LSVIRLAPIHLLDMPTITSVQDEYGNKRYTVDTDTEPDLELVYYPPHYRDRAIVFDESDSLGFAGISTDNFQIDVIEQRSRPLSDWPMVADLILKFAALSAASGFFGQAGADLYDKLKNQLTALASVRLEEYSDDVETGVHIRFKQCIEGHEVDVRIAVKSDELDRIGPDGLDVDSAAEYVSGLANQNIKRIMVGVDSNGDWDVYWYVNADGKQVKF